MLNTISIKRRNIALAVILSFITFGIYGLYWVYRLTEESHAFLGRRTTAAGGWVIVFTLITLGIYSFYWVYKIGSTLAQVKNKYNEDESSLPGVCLILSILGLGIIAVVLLQDALNETIDIND